MKPELVTDLMVYITQDDFMRYARLMKLGQALAETGGHQAQCPAMAPEQQCTCGWAAALAGWRAVVAP